jgi:hypothetical protein
MELVQKIDGNRAPLHMFEVAQLANLIPQVSVSLSLLTSPLNLSPSFSLLTSPPLSRCFLLLIPLLEEL